MDPKNVPDIEPRNSEEVKFICPNDGEISQDDVVFLCNTCERQDLMFKNGVYICPSCLEPGENFQCLQCDSKDVEMEVVESEEE